MIKTWASIITYYLLYDYQKRNRFLFAQFCVTFTLFCTFSSEGFPQTSDASQSLNDSMVTMEVFNSLSDNSAKYLYEYLTYYNNHTASKYTDYHFPLNNTYKSSSMQSDQILQNDVSLDWNYFTAWPHGDMNTGLSPPVKAWSALGSVGQTAIWGIIAAQAWNDKRKLDFAAATAVTALSTYGSFNFLRKWILGENVRIGVKPN